MSKPSLQSDIIVFDDEQEELPEIKVTKKSQDVMVFDDEDALSEEEQRISSKDSKRNQVPRKIMTNQQYRKKLSQIQERIILSSVLNSTQIKKPETNFFKQAKEKRKSIEQVYERRKSRCLQELVFQPKAGDVKVSFGEEKKYQNKILLSPLPEASKSSVFDISMNEEITNNSATQTPLAKQPNLFGACLDKKSELKIEQDKLKNVLKVSNFRQFLYTQLKLNYSIFLRIRRTENGFINSTYKVYFQENNKFIMAIEKQGFSKYVFSTSEIHIQEDHISYLGKMESNFFGTEFEMYDSGEEYSKTKMMENYKKQLTYIEYSQVEGSPRRINTFITTCDNKCTDFTILDQNDNVIQQKWKNNNKKNISQLYSKMPSFDPNECNFKLDFRGLAGIPSTKNFIIENEEYPDALIFGRQPDKESYLMRIKAPFSIMQAVAIAMSSIHHKFL